MKKFIGIAVALLMLLTVLPVGALAQELRAVPASREQTHVVTWDFETDPLEDGWQFIDSDGDGNNWEHSSLVSAHSGTYMIASASYSGGALNPDNWAITPLTELSEGTITLSYAVKSYSYSYPETYRIYVGTTDSIDEMQPVTDDLYSYNDENWHVDTIDLSEYAGQSVYVAIRHYNCYDQWRFFIDDVEILEGEGGGTEPGPDDPNPPAEEDLIVGYYFEGADALEGWTIIGTGDTEWVHSDENPGNYDYTTMAHEGTGFIMSYSFIDYVGAFEADNWAITPAVELREGSASVSFYATNANSDYPEAFDLYIGNSNDSNAMTLLQGNISPQTGYEDAWTRYEVDLSDYVGQTVYLAFYDHCYDMYEIWIDQVEFWGEGGEPIDDPYAIHEVYVDGWGSPVEGVVGIDHFFLTTPDDAPYYIIAGGWRDETDQQQMWNESHIFIAGHEYTEGCMIVAEEGYYFAEDCVFYADGGTDILDMQWCYVDEENWICYMNSIPVVCEGASEIVGDVDNDGDVDVADALLALRYVMGLIDLTDTQLAQAEVDGDGEVTIVDSLLVLRKALELIETFPVEN
ncbi:MAG: choice-of-anchor J domain-containing protein [Clostridia bacterium]|nr:choice-of-anchor J domain-containing protein [Clostridia bacterium]